MPLPAVYAEQQLILGDRAEAEDRKSREVAAGIDRDAVLGRDRQRTHLRSAVAAFRLVGIRPKLREAEFQFLTAAADGPS